MSRKFCTALVSTSRTKSQGHKRKYLYASMDRLFKDISVIPRQNFSLLLCYTIVARCLAMVSPIYLIHIDAHIRTWVNLPSELSEALHKIMQNGLFNAPLSSDDKVTHVSKLTCDCVKLPLIWHLWFFCHVRHIFFLFHSWI
jgi:hypothetical protein